MKRYWCVALLLWGGLALAFAGNAEADKLLAEGLAYFQDSQFQTAIDKFKLIADSQYLKEYHGIAHFMLGKSYMAVGMYVDAARHLEHFLLNFPDHAYFAEGYYLKGKVLFHQGDLSNAILVSEDFIARYPGSPLVPNAYFVIGECLYNAGQLDRAFEVYQHIITKYPESAKIEAAQYRASLISFKRRETELLKLLKWGFEDSLQTVEEYRQKQSAYEEAIAAYQKKLADSTVGDTEELKKLSDAVAERDLEIKSLQDKNDELTARNALLEKQLESGDGSAAVTTDAADTSADELAKKEEMLEMKERALVLKEEYLKWLQNYLESK